MADIIVVKQTVADRVAINQQATEKIAVNPAPVTITGVTLVPATNTTLGGIIVGDNLTITGNGVLSVANTFQPKTSCVTYGLTDTVLPNGPNTFYVVGEHVVQSGKNFYTGLRGRKTSAGVYQNATTYGVGGYTVDSNGTPTALSTLETSASGLLLSSSNLTASSIASTISVNSAGYVAAISSNGSSTGCCSLTLQDGSLKAFAGASAYLDFSGSNVTIGVNNQDYRFRVAGQPDFTKGVSLQRVYTTSSLIFPYIVSNGTGTFDFSSGFSFYDGDPLSAATEFQHKYTSRSSNVTSSTTIRLVSNNAELSYAQMIQVKTSNSILTQGYADTRYLTSANLTFANITSTPTTLAGYGITDGLTATDAAATYVTFSEANNAFAAKTVAINPGTGLTGGGNLALSRTLSLANTTVTAGSYGSSSLVPVLTVDAQGRLTSVTTAAVSEYTLPAATTSTLGGVRLGVGVGLDANGFLTTDVKLTTNTFTGTQNLGGNLLTQPKLQAYRETSTAPTISAGSLTLDLSGSNFFAVSLNAAISTITISNIPSSSVSSFTLEFTGTGTTYSVNWTLSSGVIKWAGAASAPTITATTGKKDVFCFYTTDGGSNWLGFIGGQNY